ncbi:MAG TPA: di-heme-cytochrome C peroxidase [Alphaproteobacteria bacterium]|nr:di-heme-cytochrome C peroxidase [Alphaproteobacteria bacterium]
MSLTPLRRAFTAAALALLPLPAVAAGVQSLDQGWSPADRTAFYTTSQGSRMMPLAWFQALERPSSQELFLTDSLALYGYLPNGGPGTLPIGFTIDSKAPGPTSVGMTCSACHTGQIDYKGQSLRIDGAPADADFGRFLRDVTDALAQTQTDGQKWNRFAGRVLGAKRNAASEKQLKADFEAFAARWTPFMNGSLPKDHWGPSRLDAFGMIFNRLTSLDVGMPQNLQPAAAPVSYPFLWNTHAQTMVQWNGAGPSGSYLKAMLRNVGEVIGVFADWSLYEFPNGQLGIKTSADFKGLQSLEEKLAALKSPLWPAGVLGPIDQAKAARGQVLYQQECASCHAVLAQRPPVKPFKIQTYDVGTDPAVVVASGRIVETGKLGSGLLPYAGMHLPPKAPATQMLAKGVIGSVLAPFSPGSHTVRGSKIAILHAAELDLENGLRRRLPWKDQTPSAADLVAELKDAYGLSAADYGVAATSAPAAGGAPAWTPPARNPAIKYESRPLNGIWATAPYLHNGSVPNLYELLLPAAQRSSTFAVGKREFDPMRVGFVTGPMDGAVFDVSKPGSSNAGHEYGGTLSEVDRQALLEYLKSL